MKTIRLLTVILLAAIVELLTGCQTHLVGGTPIPAETMNTLVVGTPYSEIIAELGPPLIYVDGERTIAYPWDTNRGYFEVHPGWNPSTDLYSKEVHAVYHALCLRFDNQKKLEAWTQLRSPSREARIQQMNDFAAGKPLAKTGT